MPRIVALVPWRAGDPARERNWDIVRPILQGPLDLEVFTGDREGEFSPGASINRAADAASLGKTPWDVAVIVDADTIPEPGPMVKAVQTAMQRRAARAHTRLLCLTDQGTEVFAKEGPAAIRNHHIARAHSKGPGILVVHRDVWAKVGGYDERFVGWGGADNAFLWSLRAAVPPVPKIEGIAWHLWHPRAERGTEHHEANKALLQEYREMKTRDEFKAVLDRRNG